MCHVAYWPFTSLSATQRYVRNRGQSGSACCKLKTTRLTPPGFNKPSATAVSMAGSGSATVKRQWRLRRRSRCRATLRVRSWHLPRPAETAFALGRGDRLVHQRRGGSQRSSAPMQRRSSGRISAWLERLRGHTVDVILSPHRWFWRVYEATDFLSYRYAAVLRPGVCGLCRRRVRLNSENSSGALEQFLKIEGQAWGRPKRRSRVGRHSSNSRRDGSLLRL